jgi:hypothetical protein
MKPFQRLVGLQTILVIAVAHCSFATRMAHADVMVVTENSTDSSFFQFEKILPPAIDDSGAKAIWAIARGEPDRNSAPLSVLFDGKIPSSDDSPTENFFFAPRTTDGCIALDLAQEIDLSEVVTYSWHPGSRGPQVYTLYASLGDQPDFRWNHIDAGADPVQRGWTQIAHVDSRIRRAEGGQHASRITDSTGTLGHYRYLLFKLEPTESDDPFGNTFFSEIDVLSRDSIQIRRVDVPEAPKIRFSSTDGRYEFTIDMTHAPEMTNWTESELKPVIIEWYPRIVEMLPSDGYEAPEKVRFRYLPNAKMEGIPAYAAGGTISMNAPWIAREKNREARGAIVHEMVHIVQSYSNRRGRNGRRMQTPGWIVEGIPDYVRWFLYEPQSGGAALSKSALSNARHDASYRVSANFIDWVVRTYDTDGTLLQKLNAAAREGRYSAEVWKELTGRAEEELAADWKGE